MATGDGPKISYVPILYFHDRNRLVFVQSRSEDNKHTDICSKESQIVGELVIKNEVYLCFFEACVVQLL